ncbi:LacI family transcriptional regulator [Tamaricihabitans halophyticus]|uniref:LacI family transcriptional regulator n=1 Tax=Tamaricihabitans halophyticus TaxID=1262583 RepID=A0A4R2QQP9_9PSEU|nr:LacI family DNA-binding transcriptional regulator [Tamaricihabitans halophyticus]TCP49355.1 LacI family transcriptional regulator [Tamaricihabitans halophyticus]
MASAGSRPHRRPKATDVAARAGVSTATVSLVINGKTGGRVSKETEQRVRAAVAELGYVVDPAARSLVTGRRHCVALVAPDVANPFFSQVASGVASALGTDYRLLLAVSGPERDSPDLEQLVAFGVDGILLDFPGTAFDTEGLDCPLVLLDEPTGPTDRSRVYFDTRPGSQQLVDRLVDLGHRQIVYMDASRPGKSFDTRRKQVLGRLRRTQDGVLHRARSDLDLRAARELVTESWPDWSARGVTAIITATDVLAYGTLSALHDLNVAVPTQVSVAAFDDLPFAEITAPALSTVRLSAFDLGVESAQILREHVEDRTLPPRTRSLDTRLVERSSIGPAAG